VSRQADSSKRHAGEADLRPSVKKQGVAEWRGFINIELSQGLKEQFDDWTHTDDPWHTLEAATSGGCTISIKQDSGGSGYLASCTQRNPTSVNAGYCLTARASTAGKAWLRVLFILSCMNIDGEWAKEGTVSDPDRW
jgi:hypothetical protein